MSLLGPNGLPIYSPPTQNSMTEERVNQELQAHWDPLLFIQWAPTVVYNEKQGQWEGRYALMTSWGEQDPRRAEQLPPDSYCDRLAWFTEDMQNGESKPVEPDQMMGRVIELLGKCDNTRYPWLQKFKDTWAHNEKVKDEVIAGAVDLAADEADYLFNKVNGNASVGVIKPH